MSKFVAKRSTKCLDGLRTSKREVSLASWTTALRFESVTSLLENMCANCYTATLGTSVRSRRPLRWISNWYRLHFILQFNPFRAWIFGENMLFFYAFLVNYKFSLSCTANCYVKLFTRDITGFTNVMTRTKHKQGTGKPHISFTV